MHIRKKKMGAGKGQPSPVFSCGARSPVVGGLILAAECLLSASVLFAPPPTPSPITDDTGGDLTFTGNRDTNGANVSLTDSGANSTDGSFVTFTGSVTTDGGLFTFTRQGNLSVGGNLNTGNNGSVSITDRDSSAVSTPSTTTFSGDVITKGGGFSFDRTGDLEIVGELNTDFGSNSGDISILGTGDTILGDVSTQHGNFTFERDGTATFNGDIVANQGNIDLMGGDMTFNGSISTNSGDFTVTSSGDITFNGDLDTNSGTITITGEGTTTVNGDINVGPTGELIIDAGTLIVDEGSNVNDGIDITLNGGAFGTSDRDVNIDTLTLTADSIIDFGTTESSSTLLIDAIDWTPDKIISVINWNFDPNPGSGVEVDDHLTFGVTLTEAQEAQIQFVDPFGFDPGTYTAIFVAPNEYRPGVLIIPETSTLLVAGLLCGLAAGDWIRRRKSRDGL